MVDAALGADVVVWTAPAGVKSHYRFVWWVTILSQYACAGIMCYATLKAPWPKRTFVKGYWKNAPTCETCGMPMSATHPGRKKLAQERAERERTEKEAEAKKED